MKLCQSPSPCQRCDLDHRIGARPAPCAWGATSSSRRPPSGKSPVELALESNGASPPRVLLVAAWLFPPHHPSPALPSKPCAPCALVWSRVLAPRRSPVAYERTTESCSAPAHDSHAAPRLAQRGAGSLQTSSASPSQEANYASFLVGLRRCRYSCAAGASRGRGHSRATRSLRCLQASSPDTSRLEGEECGAAWIAVEQRG